MDNLLSMHRLKHQNKTVKLIRKQSSGKIACSTRPWARFRAMKKMRRTTTTTRSWTRWNRARRCTRRPRPTKRPPRATATCIRWVILGFKARIRQQRERDRTMIWWEAVTRCQRSTKMAWYMTRRATRSKASRLKMQSTMLLRCPMAGKASSQFQPININWTTNCLRPSMKTCRTSHLCHAARKRQQRVLHWIRATRSRLSTSPSSSSRRWFRSRLKSSTRATRRSQTRKS